MLGNLSIMFGILSFWALHMPEFTVYPEFDNRFYKGKLALHLDLLWHVVFILCAYKKVKWKNNY